MNCRGMREGRINWSTGLLHWVQWVCGVGVRVLIIILEYGRHIGHLEDRGSISGEIEGREGKCGSRLCACAIKPWAMATKFPAKMGPQLRDAMKEGMQEERINELSKM